MIKAENITKSFGSLQVLKGIDLEVEKGEIVSIVGPSGAGKTTLLLIMGTLEEPDGGTITIDGQKLSRMSEKKLSDFRNKNIGFVFQFHQLLPEFTALENVMIPALIGNVKHARAEARARDLLQMMGIGERTSHKPSELSGGEKQRVAIARTILKNPAIFLFDEATSALDAESEQLGPHEGRCGVGEDDGGGPAQHHGRVGARQPRVAARRAVEADRVRRRRGRKGLDHEVADAAGLEGAARLQIVELQVDVTNFSGAGSAQILRATRLQLRGGWGSRKGL